MSSEHATPAPWADLPTDAQDAMQIALAEALAAWLDAQTAALRLAIAEPRREEVMPVTWE